MLHLSYVAARERKSGEIALLELFADVAAGGDTSKIGALDSEFRSREGEKLRARYSHVLVVIDNVIRANYEFPDPSIAERERKERQLSEARKALATAAQREAAAVQAATDAKAAKDERKAATARVAELEKELGIEHRAPEPQKPPSPKLDELSDEELLKLAAEHGIQLSPSITRARLISAIQAKTDGKPETSPLAELTVNDLKARCEELGIDTTGFRLKQEFIDAIETDERLSELTVPQLKEKADGLKLDTTGFRRKRQYLDAIEAYERENPPPS